MTSDMPGSQPEDPGPAMTPAAAAEPGGVPASALPPPPALLPEPSAAAAMQQPVATGLQMKRRNPVGVWIGLPLVTLGIYHLVWYYKIHHEMASSTAAAPCRPLARSWS